MADVAPQKIKVVGTLAAGSVVVGACIALCPAASASAGTVIATRVGARIGAQAVEKAIERIMSNPNILNKIFADKHLLQPLVQQLGSQRAVVTAVLEAAAAKVATSPEVQRVVVTVAGKAVEVQVFVKDGVIRINDFWVRK